MHAEGRCVKLTVHERIRQVRKENTLTMEDFGRRIGIKKASVSTMESGKSNPSDQTLRSICREFGISESWLRDGTGSMYEDVEKSARLMEWAVDVMKERDDSIKKRFVSMLVNLNESDWDLIAELAKRIKDRTE